MLSTAITIVLVLTILSIGLTVTVEDMRATARRHGLLLRALLANIVLVPAMALGGWPATRWPGKIEAAGSRWRLAPAFAIRRSRC